MAILTLTRHRGWARLFKVFVWLWYGFYFLAIGFAFVLNDWSWKVRDDFYPILIAWVAAPWILLFVIRLLRYVIEGFSEEELNPKDAIKVDRNVNLLRFFLGLVLLVSAVFTFKFIADPLAAENIVSIAAYSVGAVSGGLIWGLIIWGAIRLIRGHSNSPDIHRFTLITAAIFIAVFVVIGLTVDAPPNERDQSSFWRGVEESCFMNQRKVDANIDLIDSQLREFCSCYTASIEDIITKEEMNYIALNEAMPASLQNQLPKIAENCA